MKALSDILTRMLMLLLLMLVACTNDVAEVETPMQQGQYVSVRMNVPGMKTNITRAAEDNITSITALVFRYDALIAKETATDITETTFTIPKPKSGDVIHFLANLSDSEKDALPETGGTQTDVLCELTANFYSLRYWGMATYEEGDDLSTTLYRSMAKVEIAAAGTNCTFRDDELYIAGLANANTEGKLVPYKNGFTFDLGTNDYYTLPERDVNAIRYPNELDNPVKSLYVLEHDNLPTTDGALYIICQIGKDYYKVALTSDGETPYDIIRNHRYVIYVSDLDEGADDFDAAVDGDPINLVVKEYKDATFSVTTDQTIQYGNTLPITLTVPNGSTLKNLSITAEGFTIMQGNETLGTGNYENNSLSYTNTGVTYTFVPTSTGSRLPITFTGSGEYLNNFEQSIYVTVNKANVTFSPTGEQSILLGNSLDVQMTGVPDSKSVTLSIEAAGFTLTKDGNELSKDNEGKYTYTGGNTTFRFTPTGVGVNTIRITGGDDNINVTTAEIEVTVTAAIEATPTSSTIYYDGDDKTVTVSVTIPKGVSELEIDADDFSVKQGDTSLAYDETNDVYTYSRNDATTQENVDFVFTLKDGVTADSSITFSDASGNPNVSSDKVDIYVMETPGAGVTYSHSMNGNLHVFSITSGGDGMAPKFEVMWYSNMGYASWESAKNTCSSIHGYTDFRMPTYEEMKFLVSVDSTCELKLESHDNWWISTENSYYSIPNDNVYTETGQITSQVRCVRTVSE